MLQQFIIVISFGVIAIVRSQTFEECKYPVKVHNGYVILSNRTDMLFSCNKSQAHHSIRLKYCVDAHKSSVQYCLDASKNVLRCGYPVLLSNGYIYIEETTDNTLFYVCNYGFILLGSTVRSCQSDGFWHPSIPKCVKNLAVNIVYKNMVDNNWSTCSILSQGIWCYYGLQIEAKFDNVVIIFENRYTPNDIYVSASNYSGGNHGREIHRQRLPAHESSRKLHFRVPRGHEVAKYLAIRTPHQISICEIILYNSDEETACNRPDEPSHGRITAINSTSVEFDCDLYYSLYGEKIIYCFNGYWQFAPPVCRISQNSLKTSTNTVQTPTPSLVPYGGTVSPTTTKPKSSSTSKTQAPTSDKNSKINQLDNIREENNDAYYANIGIGMGVVAVCIILITTVCIYKRHRKNAKRQTDHNLINSESQHSESGKTENGNKIYANINIQKFSTLLKTDEISESNVDEDYSLPIESKQNHDGDYAIPIESKQNYDGDYAVPIMSNENNDMLIVENDYYLSN